MRCFIEFTPSLTIGLGLAIAAASMAIGRAQEPTAPQERFAERVDVGRILIDTRVVDDAGRPVLGLTTRDFEVTIDGAPVRVESAQWIGEQPPSPEPLPATSFVGVGRLPPPGRLVVFLIQKDLEPVRVKGLMRWSQVNGPLLASLTRDDRMAVLSFDSHLNIWLDFTSDIERVRTVLAQDVLFKNPVRLAQGPEPSILARLTQEQGHKSATIEDSLRLLGKALEPLAGSKSVVLVGYGFGRLTGTSGTMTAQGAFTPQAPPGQTPEGDALQMPAYDAARDALQAARATLLCVDVTFADRHTLALGLQRIATDTGGMVTGLYTSPQQAVERVMHAIAGYYVLFAEKPSAKAGVHRIAVRLTQTKGTVLARSSYTEP